jgi:hypothetical protein
MGELTAAEQDDARASIWEQEQALAKLREQAAVLMAPHGLPQQAPIDTPSRLADLIESRWFVAERARLVSSGEGKGDLARDALDILREHEATAAEMLGSIATLPSTGDPVRDIRLLIVHLRLPGRVKLTTSERNCVDALRLMGRRAQGQELSRRAMGGGKRKQLLAQMVSKGILTNANDEWGSGYGLAEWTGPAGRV